jgi:hypothetical protein
LRNFADSDNFILNPPIRGVKLENMVMASTEEQDRRIVLEFCHLLEKSKQLFNGLRDLPQYGKRIYGSASSVVGNDFN